MILNEAAVKRAKTPKTGQTFLRDDKVTGLALRVTAGGAKSFIFEYWLKGRSKRMTIGGWPAVTVAKAREEAMRHKTAIADGRDPAAERESERQEPTLADLIKRYVDDYAKQHRKSWERDQRRSEVHFARLARRQLSDISTGDVVKLHSSIAEDHGKVAANRAIQLLRAMFTKAREWKVFAGENPVTVKFYDEKPRERFLSPDELQKVNKALLEEPDWRWRTLFPLLLLLGTRRSELLSARWADVDLTQRTLRLPTTKAGRSHLIPLPAAAIAILESLPSRDTSEWIFPADSASGHVSEPFKAWARIRTRAGVDDYTIHDLRRTLGSWLAADGASLLVIGKALNHARASSTEVYARLQLSPIREALERNAALMFGAADQPVATDKPLALDEPAS